MITVSIPRITGNAEATYDPETDQWSTTDPVLAEFLHRDMQQVLPEMVSAWVTYPELAAIEKIVKTYNGQILHADPAPEEEGPDENGRIPIH